MTNVRATARLREVKDTVRGLRWLECGPGSLYNEYLRLLGQIAAYVRTGDNLILNLMADGGNMNFGKLQAITGRIIGPEGAEVEIRVDDVSLADAPATQVGGQSIFDARQFPINFEATYNSPAIQPQNTYAVKSGSMIARGTCCLPTLRPMTC